MTILLQTDDHAAWLDLRAADITSTDAAALFGLSPYATKFELWHRKRDNRPSSIDDNERMKWGRRLEASIAAGIAEDRGWRIAPLKVYARDEAARMGASFDFEIIGDARGPGVLEIKNVDRLEYMKHWTDEEAPAHIEIQLQHQLAVLEPLGYTWGVIAALVGGNTPALIERPRYEAATLAIRGAAGRFWQSIADNAPPDPVYPADADFVVSLYQYAEPGSLADLRGNAAANELASDYLRYAEAEKAAKEQKQSAHAELLQLIGEHERAILDGGRKISATMVAATDIAYRREGYRLFRLTQPKPKKDQK